MTDFAQQLSLFPAKAGPRTPAHRRSALVRALGMDEPTLEQALEVIHELWLADVELGDLSAQTCDKYVTLTTRFSAYATRQGHCTLDSALQIYNAWLNAWSKDRSGHIGPPALSVQHLRSCAVRAFYATARNLGWTSAHPAYVMREETATTRQGRPLLEVEYDACRAIASTLRHTRLAAAIAVAGCGAGTADIGSMSVQDVDLSDGCLWLPGSRHTARRRVRIAGQWEFDVLSDRLADLARHGDSADGGLVVRRTGSDASRQAGASIALAEVLQSAQLRSDPNIKPASISRWAALAAFEATGDISTTAALLGTRSLDTAAAAIGWDWVTQPAQALGHRPGYQPGVVT